MVVCAKLLQVRVSLKSSFGVDKEPESQAKYRGARAMHAVAAKKLLGRYQPRELGEVPLWALLAGHSCLDDGSCRSLLYPRSQLQG